LGIIPDGEKIKIYRPRMDIFAGDAEARRREEFFATDLNQMEVIDKNKNEFN
jgi:hypothetical protein